VAQERLLSAEIRESKNSVRPNSTFSGVYALSPGQTIGSNPAGTGKAAGAPFDAAGAPQAMTADATHASKARCQDCVSRVILLLHVALNEDRFIFTKRSLGARYFDDLGEIVDCGLAESSLSIPPRIVLFLHQHVHRAALCQ